MSDLLVKLYDLPAAAPHAERLRQQGVILRPAMAYEKHRVVEWVGEHFGPGWASECDVSFSNRPISSTLATEGGEIAGFACFDVTCRGFFGPVGVAPAARHRGIGRALLLSSLHAMARSGYGYAVIGGTESARFYEETVGAIQIPGSTPGIYRDRLR